MHKWHDRYEKYGLEGLKEGQRYGRPPKIRLEVIERIRKFFTKIGTAVLPKQVCQYIKEKTGKKFSMIHIRRMMCEWNLKPKVPQTVHTNAASEECYEWYRHIACVIGHALSNGTKVFMQDETIVKSDGTVTKKYWRNAGERPVCERKGDHRKFVTYGMVSATGERFFRSYDHFDGATFLAYVREFAAKYDRVLIIIDGASQHRMIELEDYLEEIGGRIRMEFLPRASPQHNIMETIWSVTKREKDHGEYYEYLEDKIYAFMEYLRTKSIPMNVMDYLKPKMASLTNL